MTETNPIFIAKNQKVNAQFSRYSSTYGLVKSKSSSQNLQNLVAVSNKAMKQELETLATQLGKEELKNAPKRPFSLHLFTHESFMDCSPDNSKLDVQDTKDEDDNSNNNTNRPAFNEYNRNLMQNIETEFSESETARTETMDLMNLLDIMWSEFGKLYVTINYLIYHLLSSHFICITIQSLNFLNIYAFLREMLIFYILY